MGFRKRRFYSRKSDVKLFFILLGFIVIIIVFFLVTGRKSGIVGVDADSAWVERDVREAGSSDKRIPQYYDQGQVRVERFTFDPNTADSTQLLRLGLAPYMVRGIYKYRANGGVYRRAEDFARVPGLTQRQYRELKPYIRISPDYLPASELPEVRERYHEYDTVLHPRKISEQERVALNVADTTQLKRVPGIGSYFARAIVNYGRRLGGYVSVDQLDEIEDFPEESKKYFVVGNPVTVRLNVNTLSVSKLKRHPYMGFYRAKAIVDYRRLHGSLKSLDDVRLSPDFTPDAIERLRPYVEF